MHPLSSTLFEPKCISKITTHQEIHSHYTAETRPWTLEVVTLLEMFSKHIYSKQDRNGKLET